MNSEGFLLNKSRHAKVCPTLLMHWFVYFFIDGRLHGAPTVARFFNTAILIRVWEWSGSGTNTQLRTRLGHWLTILCKRGGVKWHHCHQRATLTSCTFIYQSLSTQKTGQQIVNTSIQLNFQCGVLCNRSYR